MKSNHLKVLFLTKHCKLSGSSRKMVFDYLKYFRQKGIICKVCPLFTEYYFKKNIPTRKSIFGKTRYPFYFAYRVIIRFFSLMRALNYNVIVLEYEIFPYFPFLFELLLRFINRNIVTLYDDDILVYYSGLHNRFLKYFLKNKIENILKLSKHIIVWNDNLKLNYLKYNKNITSIRTALDINTFSYRVPSKNIKKVIVGWVGSYGSIYNLSNLSVPLKFISKKYAIRLKVVSSKDIFMKGVKVINKRWNLADEVRDIQSFDIGVMPLPDNDWAKGKSGCKIVQYMAVGVPVVASPIGVNKEIITHGVNGFLANNFSEWIKYISILIENYELRQSIAENARKTVENKFSLEIMVPKYVSVLRKVAYNSI